MLAQPLCGCRCVICTCSMPMCCHGVCVRGVHSTGHLQHLTQELATRLGHNSYKSYHLQFRRANQQTNWNKQIPTQNCILTFPNQPVKHFFSFFYFGLLTLVLTALLESFFFWLLCTNTAYSINLYLSLSKTFIDEVGQFSKRCFKLGKVSSVGKHLFSFL